MCTTCVLYVYVHIYIYIYINNHDNNNNNDNNNNQYVICIYIYIYTYIACLRTDCARGARTPSLLVEEAGHITLEHRLLRPVIEVAWDAHARLI